MLSSLTLLRSHPPFRRLFAAMTYSAVGTYLAALALSVDVYDKTGSGRWLAALLVADFLPIILVGLVLGPLVDRLQRKRLMIGADLTRLLVFAALPFVHAHPAAIVALAGVNGVATGFFRPAVWAGVPNLVDDEDLDAATSLLSTVENAAWMVGPVLAGVLLAIWDPAGAYWINAASFLVSAALLARLSPRDLQSAEPISRGHWRDVRDGIAVVRRSAPLLTVAIVWNSAAIGIAAINVPEVVFAKSALGVGNVGLGILVGAMGLGLVIGSVAAPLVLGSLGIGRVYGGGILLMSLGFGSASLAPTLATVLPLVVVASIGNGCAIVCNQLLVQRGAEDRFRGRALAVLMSSYYAVLPVGMALAGWLTDREGPRATWFVGAVVLLAASAVAFLRTGRARALAIAPPPAPAAPAPPVALAAGPEATATGVERMRGLLAEIARARLVEAETQRPRRRVFKYAKQPQRRDLRR